MGLFFEVLYLNTWIKKFPHLILIFYWSFIHIMGWIQRNIKADNGSEEEDCQVIYLIKYHQKNNLKVTSILLLNYCMTLNRNNIKVNIWTPLLNKTFYYLFTNILIKNPIVNNIGLQWETSLFLSTDACSWIFLIGILLQLQSNFQNVIIVSLATNVVIGLFIIIFSQKNSKNLMQKNSQIYFFYQYVYCPSPQEVLYNLNNLKSQQQNQQNVENQSNEIQQAQINQNVKNNYLMKAIYKNLKMQLIKFLSFSKKLLKDHLRTWFNINRQKLIT
ncbi:hypothetical protein ABPG72_009665 [Tetrahymena utriculariae]